MQLKSRDLVQLERITFRADLTFQKNLFYFFALNLILSLRITFPRNYTIKSNEKEAEHPVFTRDCRHDTGCGKLPVFVGWHRGFTRSLRRFECFWLFDFKTGHEPVELLPGQLLYFQLISGQAESALDFHTFIQQHKSVRFPEQSFDPVTTFSTEKIQGASPWIHMELILYNSTQPVNGFPHIRSACYDIDFIGGCDIP